MTIQIIRLVRHPGLFLLIFGAAVLLWVGNAGALSPDAPTPGVMTNAELRQCRQDWNGNSYNLTIRAENDAYKQFKADDCYKGNNQGGKCTYITQTDRDPDSPTHRDTFADITCPRVTSGDPADTAVTDAEIEDLSDPALAEGGCTGDKCAFIDAYINPFIKLLSALVGIVAIIFIIFGAIQVSSSTGDPQKSANGKDHIRNALIGLVAYVLLFAFLNFLIPGGIT